MMKDKLKYWGIQLIKYLLCLIIKTATGILKSFDDVSVDDNVTTDDFTGPIILPEVPAFMKMYPHIIAPASNCVVEVDIGKIMKDGKTPPPWIKETLGFLRFLKNHDLMLAHTDENTFVLVDLLGGVHQPLDLILSLNEDDLIYIYRAINIREVPSIKLAKERQDITKRKREIWMSAKQMKVDVPPPLDYVRFWDIIWHRIQMYRDGEVVFYKDGNNYCVDFRKWRSEVSAMPYSYKNGRDMINGVNDLY